MRNRLPVTNRWLVGLGVAIAAALPNAAGAHRCLPLSFEGERVIVDPNGAGAIAPCTSPIGFCTEGTFRGTLGGLPVEVRFHLDVDVLDAPFPDSPLANTSLYVARVTLILDQGEIHIREHGFFDPLPDPAKPLPPGTGLFAAHEQIAGGSNRFEDATGTLSVVGRSTDPRTFPASTEGEVCVREG